MLVSRFIFCLFFMSMNNFRTSCRWYDVFSLGYTFGILLFESIEAARVNPVVFVILSQQNEYHERIASAKKLQITSELATLKREKDKVLIAPSDFNYELGYWIITTLFQRLVKIPQISWAIFLEEQTGINTTKLLEVLSGYDGEKDYFIGHGLNDEQPTIIHHFDSVSEDEVIIYPDFSAGFAVSSSVLKKGSKKLNEIKEQGFSIDAKYEFAKFLMKEIDGLRLDNSSHFCLLEKNSECATWIESDFPPCESILSKENVMFAVKTCQKYHSDRIKVVKNTWAKEAEHLKVVYFSDLDDPSIPTIDLHVENVDSGHCEKTMSIIRYLNDLSDHEIKWVAVVDDDTLISVPRLLKLLACYNSSEYIALGERYGYELLHGKGYDYITGGGGMIFSMPTIKLLAHSCQCPSLSSPDDMIIGICLKQNGVPIVHSNHFHQARPEDYSSEFLKHHKAISFHKHWMTDPYRIYETWLRVPEHEHSEL